MDYHEPVSRLLALGEEPVRQDAWPDYLAMGFTPADVPELIRLARDAAGWSDDTTEPWGPIHAWRTLGQLRAAEAVPPLVALLAGDTSDWISEEVPGVLVMIGPAALEPLREALSSLARGEDVWVAAIVANSVQLIGVQWPEARDEAVSILAAQLGAWGDQDPELNGVLVAELLDLEAEAVAPVMEAAFAAGAVDETIAGDWEDVQVALGLIPERTTPRAYGLSRGLGLRDEPSGSGGHPGSAKARKKAKDKKKAQKAARQKSRRKKR
jgi:hypothetical protein